MNAPETPEASKGEAKPETPLSLARFILLLALAAWALRSLIIQPFNIPSASMLPTLYIGDYLMVAKWPYGYSRYSFPFGIPSFDGRILGQVPKRGDVVVFRHPTQNSDLIKRVIGIPGDTVAIMGGRLILNGQPIERRTLPPARVAIASNSPCRVVAAQAQAQDTVRSRDGQCLYPAFLETLPGGPSYMALDQFPDGPADDVAPVRVPEGHLFLMGDNRDDSLDSRFSPAVGGIAMVPVENVVGRAMVTFWSTDGSASYLKPWTWFSALRADRIGNTYSGAAE